MCSKIVLLGQENQKGQTICPFCKKETPFHKSLLPFWSKDRYYGDLGISTEFGSSQLVDSDICTECWNKYKGFGLVEFDIHGLKEELKRLNYKTGMFFSPLMVNFQGKIFLVLPFKE